MIEPFVALHSGVSGEARTAPFFKTLLALLLGNGRELMPDCSGAALRPAQTTATTTPAATTQIRLYPNPSTGQFFVELPAGAPPVRLSLYAPDGRVALERRMTASEVVNAAGLPPGLYLYHIVDANGLRAAGRLVLSD